MEKPGKRHRLLLYSRQLARLRGVTLLISVMFFILWWYALRVPPLSSELAQAALLVAGSTAALFFLYSLLGPTRLDRVADGFGCRGVRVEHKDELVPALQSALTADQPAVIHVPIVPGSPAD